MKKIFIILTLSFLIFIQSCTNGFGGSESDLNIKSDISSSNLQSVEDGTSYPDKINVEPALISAVKNFILLTEDIRINDIRIFYNSLIDKKLGKLLFKNDYFQIYELKNYSSYQNLVTYLEQYFEKPALYYYIELNMIKNYKGKCGINLEENNVFRYYVTDEKEFSIKSDDGDIIVVNVPYKDYGIGRGDYIYGSYTLKRKGDSFIIIDIYHEVNNLQFEYEENKEKYPIINNLP